MTTITLTRKKRFPFSIVLLVAIILLASLPPLNKHAVGKHGIDAAKAWAWVATHGPDDDDDDFWHGHSDDGRDFYIVKLPKASSKTMWAIVIVGGGGAFLVTAFLCSSRNTVRKIKHICEETHK